MKHTKIAAIVISACLLILTACAPSVTEGEVRDKNYHPSWVEYRAAIRSGDVTIPAQTIIHPERWTVTICNNVPKKGTENNVNGAKMENKCSSFSRL